MKINDPLMDQVKASVTLTIELISITKRVQMLLLAENISFARSEFRSSRNNVSKEIFARIPREAMLVFTGHDPR